MSENDKFKFMKSLWFYELLSWVPLIVISATALILYLLFYFNVFVLKDNKEKGQEPPSTTPSVNTIITTDTSFVSCEFDIQTGESYCHRKFGPLSKPRVCYTNGLTERSLRWLNEENLPLSLKQESFLRPSAVKLPKQNCVGGITSAKSRSLSGSSSLLKTRHLSLSRGIIHPRTRRSGSLNWSNSLAG